MKKEIFYDCINLILSFLLCRWLFMTFLFYQFSNIFMTIDFWPILAAILLMTGFCFTLFRLVYKPHISRLTLCFFLRLLRASASLSSLFQKYGRKRCQLGSP